MERYLAISEGCVQFLDSFQIMMKSLDMLTSTLNYEDFVETGKVFGEGEEFARMRKKGGFAYYFFDDISKLKTIGLPQKEIFYNRLEDKKCSDKEYAHVHNVWDIFDCQTFQDYHDLDIPILTDFFRRLEGSA